MANSNTTVDAYVGRLELLGGVEDHVGRFYVALHDERLRDLEEQLTARDAGLALYQPVLDLYTRWRREMGDEKWAEVWAHNEALSDADRNWLISEAMGDVLISH